MGLENRVMLTFSKVSPCCPGHPLHQIVFPWPAECEHAREHLRTALATPSLCCAHACFPFSYPFRPTARMQCFWNPKLRLLRGVECPRIKVYNTHALGTLASTRRWCRNDCVRSCSADDRWERLGGFGMLMCSFSRLDCRRPPQPDAGVHSTGF